MAGNQGADANPKGTVLQGSDLLKAFEDITEVQIEIGNAYWFKHKYKEPVIFQEDTSVAIPLENYVIDLKEGWNLIGSPFSFPVQFEKDSIVNDPITYGISDKANGWASSQSLFSPRNGYAVFTPERATITLLPFPEEDNPLNSIILSNEWYLNILLENIF